MRENEGYWFYIRYTTYNIQYTVYYILGREREREGVGERGRESEGYWLYTLYTIYSILYTRERGGGRGRERKGEGGRVRDIGLDFPKTQKPSRKPKNPIKPNSGPQNKQKPSRKPQKAPKTNCERRCGILFGLVWFGSVWFEIPQNAKTLEKTKKTIKPNSGPQNKQKPSRKQKKQKNQL